MIEVRTDGRRKLLLSLMVLAGLALSAGDALAVRFDMWETGMDMNQIAGVAKRYDLPIARSGLVHSSPTFDEKLLDDQFFRSSVLEYKTKIGKFGSKIYLRMSDPAKRLYEIEVAIHGIKDRKEFMREMVGILMQKYGSYKEREEGALQYFQWKPDGSSRITLRIGPGEASVFYTDLKIKGPSKPREKKK